MIGALSGLGSLGFVFYVRDEESNDHDLAGSGPIAVITWHNLSVTNEEAFEGQPLVVANAMLGLATDNYCEEHGREAIVDHLNFSALASSTKTEHTHEHVET